MKDSCHLIFTKNAVVRMSKRRPDLSAGEFCVKLNVEIDDKFFRQPDVQVLLQMAEKHVIKPQIQAQLEVANEDD